MKKIVFILNSKIKNKSKILKDIKDTFSANYTIFIRETQARNHAASICRDAIAEGTDYIISVGGDGTLNETINGFMTSDTELRKNVIFGILPSGTGNDFARGLQMTKSAKHLLKIIETGKTQLIDIGQAVFSVDKDKINSRYFINIADVGIGAATVKIVNGSSKYLGANLTFVLGILRAFLGYKHQKIKLLYNNKSYEGKIVSVVFANGSYFGSGLGIAPFSSISDGLFDLVIVGYVKILDFIRYLPTLKKKQKIEHPEVFYEKTTYCRIESLEHEDFPIEMDGEYVGNTPIEINLVPAAIKFLAE